MKMIFKGGKKRLTTILAIQHKVFSLNYAEEYKRGEVGLSFNWKDTLVVRSDNPTFSKEMLDDFNSARGRLYKAQLRLVGVKVHISEEPISKDMKKKEKKTKKALKELSKKEVKE